MNDAGAAMKIRPLTNADADAFPLDRPVLVTDIEAAIGKAGADGTLAKSLRAIADQTRPIIVVVRVEEGEDAAETASNVIGTTDANGQKTGMQALLAAQAQLGVRPKIIGTPGLETQAVTAALAVVAQKLRGFAYARAIGATVAEAILYRANFSARELMLLMPDFLAWDTVASANVTSYAAARAVFEVMAAEQPCDPMGISNVCGTGLQCRTIMSTGTSFCEAN